MQYSFLNIPKNKKYKHGDNVLIELLTQDGRRIVREYSVFEGKKIYSLIEKQQSVNLNNCFVKDFSLNEFRKKYHLPENELVRLINFSAHNAFFYCENAIDFSFADFGNNENSFYNAIFSNGDVSFKNADFGTGRVIFKNVIFGNGHTDFSYCKFSKENLDFSNTIFGDGSILFTRCSFGAGVVNFSNTLFGKGDIDFSMSEFGSAGFEIVNEFFLDENNEQKLKTQKPEQAEIIFSKSRFGDGCVSFKNANFGNSNINFSQAIFGTGEINFSGAEFGHGKFEFDNTQFGDGNVNFFMTNFRKGNIYFSNAVFGKGDISFTLAHFGDGDINFSSTKFGAGEINFTRTEFSKGNVNFLDTRFGNGNIYFTDALIDKIFFKDCQFNFYVDFRFKSCSFLDLKDSIVRDIMEIDNIDKLNLARLKNPGKIYLDWEKNNVKDLILSQRGTNALEKAEQFHILKENYRATGKYNEEDKAYLWFRRSKLNARKIKINENKKGLIKQFSLFICFLEKIAFDWVGGYGTCPVKIIRAMGFTWIFFTFIYTLPGVIIHDGIGKLKPMLEPGFLNTFLNSVYYSAITFLTIGYGDLSPQNFLSAILSALEGFIGLFLISYFTVAFVRKVLR